MNKKRREKIEGARELVDQARYIAEIARTEEQDYFEALPAGPRGADKGAKAQAAVKALQTAVDLLDKTRDEFTAAAT